MVCTMLSYLPIFLLYVLFFFLSLCCRGPIGANVFLFENANLFLSVFANYCSKYPQNADGNVDF